MITKSPFGRLADGREIFAYQLTNSRGMAATVLTWGGILSSLRVPDRDGRLGEVVLGFNALAPYLERHPYFGAITGRIAGRVAGGKLQLEDQTWQLSLNDGPNHLHGGFDGLDRRVWQAETRGDTLVLHYHSPHGEEGYPGALDITVKYTLTEDCILVFETSATSNRSTPLSLTQHSYFNLAGDCSGTIENHRLQVFSDTAFERDPALVTNGKTFCVVDKPGDFREPKRIGNAIPQLFQHHGDFYHIQRTASTTPVPVARVADPVSGRVLEVRSTQTCMLLYTSSHFPAPIPGRNGRLYPRFGGLCVECKGYPDTIHPSAHGDILVYSDRPQHHITEFVFSTDGAITT